MQPAPPLPADHFLRGRRELVEFVDAFDPLSRERAALYLQLLAEYLTANATKRRALDRRLAALELQIAAQAFRPVQATGI